MNDFYRNQDDAGCAWMRLVERQRRDERWLHFFLLGIGIGMVLFGFATQTLRMIP